MRREGRTIDASLRVHGGRWAGRGSKGGARGDLLRFHQERRDWLLHDTRNQDPQHAAKPRCAVGSMCPVYPLATAMGRADLSNPDWMPRAMALSDFCYAPLGQSDGDSDRYLPAVLYGCIPIFAQEHEALPLEEGVDWSAAALRVRDGSLSPLPTTTGRKANAESLPCVSGLRSAGGTFRGCRTSSLPSTPRACKRCAVRSAPSGRTCSGPSTLTST